MARALHNVSARRGQAVEENKRRPVARRLAAEDHAPGSRNLT
jgi:hypothetical protein